MKDIRALGDRSVSAEQIRDSLVNTGIFFLFAEAPQEISSFIRIQQFRSLVEERTRSFVGRDYIFQAIDGHMADQIFGSGYIVLKGEPGIGKTALIAKLVEQRGYAHHFNISQQQINSTDAFLKNISAQLIIRYDLPYSTLPLPQVTADSGFLVELLAQAVDKSQQNVIVVVDALDESEVINNPTANTLLLPPALPQSVFFVVTTRESNEVQLQVDQKREIYINETDPRNVEDVRNYVRAFIFEHPAAMKNAIASWVLEEADFVEIITEKSEGNFMYLVYVLADIRAGRLNSTNIGKLRDLPVGLRNYYERHWKMMRSVNPEVFENLHQQVICVLASAGEAVSLDQLKEWTHLTFGEVQRAITEWREFLNEEHMEGGGSLYRIYHTSFRDFLREAVGLTQYNSLIATHMDQKVNHYGGR